VFAAPAILTSEFYRQNPEEASMSTTTRKRCRHGEPCVPVSLKESFDCLGHHSEDRTLAEIAERVGATETTLGKQVSRYDEGNDATAWTSVPLMQQRRDVGPARRQLVGRGAGSRKAPPRRLAQLLSWCLRVRSPCLPGVHFTWLR
jgi:hypothetical protein